ncbi:alpha/beta hydrolase [Pseudonocardia kujensis]|uniref:alpha/beta hydrolase n=1 Tax=Pseudonocardia kujensis TaxID=1128675 RepID=UPI001E3E2EC7|nr:alpha/beta hydrolase [Pseudonocardia kujensis]MCE0763052.1 alpha/beta hydrolase [Pseudonocardia kujensis]
MTISLAAVPVLASWREPETVATRGTVLVVPGRGEHAGVYERFGRRISADGYRVWAVADPTTDPARTEHQVRALLESEPDSHTGPHPRVLVGSDAGALFAAGLAADLPGVAGLVLAGLTLGSSAVPEDEITARTACPVHQARLRDDNGVRHGALDTPPPAGWIARADPARVRVPVLGLHGQADTIAPLDDVRRWYSGLDDAELVTVSDGRHDALNDATHRSAAAVLVLFLERLRVGVPTLTHREVL